MNEAIIFFSSFLLVVLPFYFKDNRKRINSLTEIVLDQQKVIDQKIKFTCMQNELINALKEQIENLNSLIEKHKAVEELLKKKNELAESQINLYKKCLENSKQTIKDLKDRINKLDDYND